MKKANRLTELAIQHSKGKIEGLEIALKIVTDEGEYISRQKTDAEIKSRICDKQMDAIEERCGSVGGQSNDLHETHFNDGDGKKWSEADKSAYLKLKEEKMRYDDNMWSNGDFFTHELAPMIADIQIAINDRKTKLDDLQRELR